MNTYIAFYKSRQLEVKADTSYKAQLKAAELFKAKKSYEVTIALAATPAGAVVHVADL